MRNRRNKIIAAIKELSDRLFPNGEGDIFLYGSRATGMARKDSDWDLLIITDDSLRTEDNFLNFAFPFAEIGWKFGEQITPMLYSRSQWEKESGTSFYHNVINSMIPLSK